MRRFDVYRCVDGHYRLYDSVFFTEDCDPEYVRDSLVNHDGYPADIRVFMCVKFGD